MQKHSLYIFYSLDKFYVQKTKKINCKFAYYILFFHDTFKFRVLFVQK